MKPRDYTKIYHRDTKPQRNTEKLLCDLRDSVPLWYIFSVFICVNLWLQKKLEVKMNRFKIVFIFFTALFSLLPALLFAQQGSMDWTQATANAGWLGRAGHTSVVFDNKMWVMGGYPYRNDVWYSTNGVNWTQATANAGWPARTGHTSVVFDNKMWVMGGADGSGYSKRDVWYSSDGVNWTQATANAQWLARHGHTSVVFDNKMWVIGGNAAGYRNDVWYSTDGVNWTQATANAGWSARYGHTSVVFDNKMWVMGGVDMSNYRNNVWYSTDGVNWTQATASAGWSARYYHASVVFDNKMLVLGGEVSGGKRNDVWFSTNGVNWIQATANAQWSARYVHTSVVFDNKMWVMGGDDGSYKRDVWYSRGGITLLIPNGGENWAGGSNQIIRWRTIGTGFARYRLLLSRNSGSTYPDTIVHNVAPTETSYNWTVPLINSTTCRIMVQMLDAGGSVINQDASDGNFTIQTSPTVITPNGGEIWPGGSNQIIKWRTVGPGFARYRLLLSRSSDSTYTDTIAHNIAPTETTYNWLVLLLNLTTCRVMVQVLDAGGTVVFQDASDANFTIRILPTVVSPNGGEVWPGGSNQIIKWRTIGSGFARYRLVLSINGGATYPDTIAQVVAPTETTYNWTVSALNLTTCRIMVQMLDAGGSVIHQDASDGNFTISTTGIAENEGNNLPFITALYSPKPNPVTKGLMQISFSLAEPSQVSLKIYDAFGRLVKILINNQYQTPGIYSITWNSKDENERAVAEGVYFYTLETPKQKFTKKMIFVR